MFDDQREGNAQAAVLSFGVYGGQGGIQYTASFIKKYHAKEYESFGTVLTLVHYGKGLLEEMNRLKKH